MRKFLNRLFFHFEIKYYEYLCPQLIATIMKKVFISWMLALVAVSCWAQEQFTGMWQCEALKATLVINLVEKKIPLKDFEGEDTYGYVKGELNGTWVILKV